MACEVHNALFAEERERIASQRLKEEFVKIQNENKKLEEELKQIGITGQKTTVEIDKLRAELRQLTAPWKTPPFCLSVATITVSFVLAMVAGYSVILQEKLGKDAVFAETRKVDAKQEELNREKAKLDKKQEDFDVQKKDLDKQVARVAELKEAEEKASRELSDRKWDLAKSQGDLTESRDAQALAEGILVFSAKHTLDTYDALIGQVSEQSLLDDREFQFASTRLKPLLAALEKSAVKARVLAGLLTHESDDVRRLAMLFLSRLDAGMPEAPSEKTALARKILDALKTETAPKASNLMVSALSRLGAEAAQPLLEEVDRTEGESRRFIVRAMGELGKKANPEIIRRLIGLVSDPATRKPLQRTAVVALGTIGTNAADAESSMMAILPMKLTDLPDDPDSFFLLRDTVSSLRKIGCKDPQTPVRLAELLDVDTLQWGNASLADDLRVEIIIALGAFGTQAKAGAPKIKAILAKKNVRPDLLQEAAIALVKIGDAMEINLLLKDNDSMRRLAGVVALTAVPSAATRKQVLESALDKVVKGGKEVDRSGIILSSSVVTALRKRGKVALPVLLDALSLARDSYVRENLVKTIGDIGEDSDAIVDGLIAALLPTPPGKDFYVQSAAIRSLVKVAPGNKKATDAILKVADDLDAESRLRSIAQSVQFTNVPADNPWGTQTLGEKASRYDKELDKFYNLHTYRFEKGKRYQIDMTSKSIDAFLYLKRGPHTIAFDDDSAGNLDARILYDPDETEDLQIWATTYPRHVQGDYQLAVRKITRKAP